MRSRSLAWGAEIGVALGVAYTISPLTVWFGLVMVGLFLWAGRGLPDRERRCVWGILAIAVAIRVLAIGALFLASDRYSLVSFFWDGDGVFLKFRAIVIRDVWLGIPASPIDVYNSFMPYYGWSSYIYVLAYLQYLTGPAPFSVHFLNVTLFVATAVVMHRIVRVAYGRAPAVFGLALMLLLPTLIAWSVSALKESLYVFLFAVGLWGAVTTIRASRWHARLLGAAVLAGAIAANSTVRVGAGLVMIAGFGAGLAGSVIVRRALLVLLVLVCLPVAAVRVWERPSVRAQIMSQLKLAATQHLLTVRTGGYTYALLDERIYLDKSGAASAVVATMTPDEGLRFAVRAFVSFVVVPLPWQIPSASGMAYLPQQVIWYLLLGLACVGLIAGLRRDALVTCLLVGLSVAGSATIALNSGNIGTLVRFRDSIVPFVVWLSALGATSIASRIMSRDADATRPALENRQPAAPTDEAAFRMRLPRVAD